MEPTIVSAVACNQFALDFDGNRDRIIESIRQAKLTHRAKIRCGSELEIPGYSCEDHLLEPDTIYHSWQVMGDVLKLTRDAPYNDILCLLGMPINHRGVVYNCGVFVFGGKIVLIKPKLMMADDGNYRESRWFTPWKGGTVVMDFALPSFIAEIAGQSTVPFGNAILRTEDGYLIGAEYCEELWCPVPSSTSLFLQGAHIILNISGSHFHLRKLIKRRELIRTATIKTGGIYVYANCRGCDGSRLYFDGACMIAMNGNFLGVSSQFQLKDIDVVSAAVDMAEVDSYRGPVPCRSMQARESVHSTYPVINIPGFRLTIPGLTKMTRPMIQFNDLRMEEEIAYAPACYMWDFLRRSGARGFFLPLSGGSDSTAVTALAGVMCDLIMKALEEEKGYNLKVIKDDLIRILGEIPKSRRDLSYKLMHAAYMYTENSTEETRSRARRVADDVGVHFSEININEIVSTFVRTFQRISGGSEPKFVINGGNRTTDLALQNIQARTRMIMSYCMGQLYSWTERNNGYLLVLGAANIEEGLTGYMTKYDCSSADLNPIGGISKVDLKRFLLWAAEKYNYESLKDVAFAPPTAELQPLAKDQELVQTDEADLGLSYRELGIFARYRKCNHCGPLFMFKRLGMQSGVDPVEIAQKIKRFHALYGRNRHKLSVVTPSIHIDSYSADDNRYDLRPILYNPSWPLQFEAIDEELKNLQLSNTL